MSRFEINNLQMKRCFKCGTEKALSEFYRHPQMADGFLGKCKECTRRDVALWAGRIDYDRKRNVLPHRVQARREYQRSARGKDAHFRALRHQREMKADKYYARNAVGNAIRDGKLIRQPCSVCGSLKSQAHHDDYSKPLDVKWLCNEHHRAEHRKVA